MILKSLAIIFWKKLQNTLIEHECFWYYFIKWTWKCNKGEWKTVFMQSEQFIVMNDVSFARKDVFSVRLVIRNVIN